MTAARTNNNNGKSKVKDNNNGALLRVVRWYMMMLCLLLLCTTPMFQKPMLSVMAATIVTTTTTTTSTNMTTSSSSTETITAAKPILPQNKIMEESDEGQQREQSSSSSSLLSEDPDWECTCLGASSSSSSSDYSGDGDSGGARILYLITVHNQRTLDDAVYLFRAIRDVRNTILIHIDTKLGGGQGQPTNNNNSSSSNDNNPNENDNSDNHYTQQQQRIMAIYQQSQLYSEIQDCSCGATVIVESLYDCKWGSWSMNLPTIWAMTTGVALLDYQQQPATKPSKHYQNTATNGNISNIMFDVFINLSGDTMAVLTPNTMAQLFARKKKKTNNQNNSDDDDDPILHEGVLSNINFCTSSACETGLRPTNLLEFPSHWHKRTHYDHGQPIILLDCDDYDHAEYMDHIHHRHRPIHNRSNYPTFSRFKQQQRSSSSTTTTLKKNYTLYIHFGSQWMTLTREFCIWLVQSLQHPNSLASRFRNVLMERQFLMSDETYFTTLLVHVFPHTLPKIHNTTGALLLSTNHSNDNTVPFHLTAIRYERMDEHVPTALDGRYPIHPRYQVPELSRGVLDEPRVWGPYYLGIYDLWSIRQSGALFCRKVSTYVDENIMNVLPVDAHDQIPPIHWPQHGVSISEMPNWERQKAKFLQQQQQAKAKETEQQQIPQHLQQILDEKGKLSSNENSQPPIDNNANNQQHFSDRDDEIASDL